MSMWFVVNGWKHANSLNLPANPIPFFPSLKSIICFLLLHPALVFSYFPHRSPPPQSTSALDAQLWIWVFLLVLFVSVILLCQAFWIKRGMLYKSVSIITFYDIRQWGHVEVCKGNPLVLSQLYLCVCSSLQVVTCEGGHTKTNCGVVVDIQSQLLNYKVNFFTWILVVNYQSRPSLKSHILTLYKSAILAFLNH